MRPTQKQHSLSSSGLSLLLHLDDHRDTTQSLLERAECRALWEEHQQAEQRPYQWGLLLGHQQLQAEKREDGTLDELNKLVNLAQQACRDLNVGKLLHEV